MKELTEWMVNNMGNNMFFKPTPIYREYIILDSINKNKNITQRELSEITGVAVSMINNHLNAFEKNRVIKKKYLSTRTVEYYLTKKGLEQKKVLNIGYLSSSLEVYNSARKNTIEFLNQIVLKGFKNILLYGAGEVAEILLQTIELDKSFPINVLGIIDDDMNKQNQLLVNKKIIPFDNTKEINHDGILISSYTNKNIIMERLLNHKYDTKKILQFFDW